MRQSAAAAWGMFTARQTISVARCAFDWKARTGPLGMVSVRDALVDGSGILDVRALGIVRLAHAAPTAQLTRGELMRYLAELPWAPDAILRNTGLRWREEGPDRLMVGAGSGESAAEVTLDLDREGRIAGAFAPDRGALIDGVTAPAPWRGAFSHYRLHDGVWLPFFGEVSWEMPAGAFTYWQGHIRTWERSDHD
nr:DUF6544 family protein [Brevundimonas lutea]